MDRGQLDSLLVIKEGGGGGNLNYNGLRYEGYTLLIKLQFGVRIEGGA